MASDFSTVCPKPPDVTKPILSPFTQIGSYPLASASFASTSIVTSTFSGPFPSRSITAASRPTKAPLSQAIQRSMPVMPGV